MATTATDKPARVLVAYATRHGTTQGIAERIAAKLRESGAEVTVQSAGQADNPADYDAVVIGSALYYFRWLKEAADYVQRHSAALAGRPVWLFSSGPLGTAKVDAQGNDVRATAGPRELPAFEAAFHPREHRVFFGAFDPQSKPVGFVERVVHLLPAARNAFPVGDFRDWQEIDAWAGSIASALISVPVAGEWQAGDVATGGTDRTTDTPMTGIWQAQPGGRSGERSKQL